MRRCSSLAYLQYATLLAPCLDANPGATQRSISREQALARPNAAPQAAFYFTRNPIN